MEEKMIAMVITYFVFLIIDLFLVSYHFYEEYEDGKNLKLKIIAEGIIYSVIPFVNIFMFFLLVEDFFDKLGNIIIIKGKKK